MGLKTIDQHLGNNNNLEKADWVGNIHLGIGICLIPFDFGTVLDLRALLGMALGLEDSHSTISSGSHLESLPCLAENVQ